MWSVLVQTLGNAEALGKKVRIVLNRVGGDCDISLKKAEPRRTSASTRSTAKGCALATCKEKRC